MVSGAIMWGTHWICLVFFLSGGAALIFETIWFRQTGLVFGNSVWAASLVLASFMGGLALGNGLAARLGERTAHPLRLYIRLELGIACTGFLLVLLLPSLPSLLAPLFRAAAVTPWGLNALRCGIAFILLLLPTTAMGATLPLLVRALTATDSVFGSVLGRLYGWNTVGAVAGVAAAELFLIQSFGLRLTGAVAASANGIAAALAWWVARQQPSAGMAPVTGATAHEDAPSRRSPDSLWPALAAAFLCGALLLAAEVIWTRLMLLFVYGTHAAFAAMLCIVLGGIGLGGLLGGAWLRRNTTAFHHAVGVAAGCGIALVLSYRWLELGVLRYNAAAPNQFLAALPLTSVIALTTALGSGLLFTLLGAAIQHTVHGAARPVGLLTMANTVGGMCGALLGGFVCLPRLGMERSLFLLACGYGVVALLLYFSSVWTQVSHTQRRQNLVPAVALLLTLLTFPFGRMERQYLGYPIGGYVARGFHVAAVREGQTETAMYLREDLYGVPYRYQLVTNSHPMSSTEPAARRYMKLYVYLPAALHPKLERALLISYGVGSTAKALTDTRSLQSIDVVDISRNILDLGRIPYANSDFPLDDPRVRVHIEDGRQFLLTTPNQYDLITAEPPPPKNAGITNLYSQEYFQLLYDRLATGGMVTYWLPVSQLHQTESLHIIRGFCSVFADCSLWQGSNLEWMLFGTRGAQGPATPDHFTAQWRDPIVAPELTALGLERPEQLGALFIADAPQLAQWTADTPPLTDNFPYRITAVPAPFFANLPHYRPWAAAPDARDRFANSAFIATLWPDALRTASLPYFAWQGMLLDHLVPTADHTALIRDLDRLLTESPLRTTALWLLQSNADTIRIIRAIAAHTPPDTVIAQQLGIGALIDGDWRAAADYFSQAQRLAPQLDLRFLDLYRAYAASRLTP